MNVLQNSSFSYDQIQKETQVYEGYLAAKTSFNMNQNTSEKV